MNTCLIVWIDSLSVHLSIIILFSIEFSLNFHTNGNNEALDSFKNNSKANNESIGFVFLFLYFKQLNKLYHLPGDDASALWTKSRSKSLIINDFVVSCIFLRKYFKTLAITETKYYYSKLIPQMMCFSVFKLKTYDDYFQLWLNYSYAESEFECWKCVYHKPRILNDCDG